MVSAGAFSSLGVALPAMVRELGWNWSATPAWATPCSGVACGLASLFPALLIRRIGVRGTMALGMAVMIAGFGTMAMAQSVWSYLLATC